MQLVASRLTHELSCVELIVEGLLESFGRVYLEIWWSRSMVL